MKLRTLAPIKAALLVGGAFVSLQSATAANAEMRHSSIVVAQAAQERQQEREGRRERESKPDGAADKPARRDEPKRPPQGARAPEAQQQNPAAQQQEQKPAAQQQKPAAQQQKPEADQKQRREAQPERRPQPGASAQPQQQQSSPPAAQDRRQPTQQAPSTAQQPQRPDAAAQNPRQDSRDQDRRDERRDAERDRRPGAQQKPTAQQQPPAAAQRQQQAPATLAPPTQARDAREFIRRGNDGPGRGMDQVRRERREVREGDRTVIREQDRAIIREGGRTIIRHNEANRFAVGARDVRVDRRGGNIETVIERGNGVRIVTVTDADGRLIRRVRRDRGGRDVVIIDNSFAGPRTSLFVQLAAPTIRIPRERYIVEMGRARPQEIYDVFLAPPVQRVESRYTLEQVRYSQPLRAHMPRVDLDINFETGSWQLTPDQIGKLEVIAQGIIRAIERNPREVVLIEGHTDAVGTDEDNLSLSDRRAESVAIALTEEFQVPPENLVTQGYGEQDLKVATDGPSRENRRVAVRRVTPLIDQQVSSTGGR